jgi:GNAT superfamily N-acetyltransferase
VIFVAAFCRIKIKPEAPPIETHPLTIPLRTYKPADRDAVWQLHVDGLNQTGSFAFHPQMDDDFDDIHGIYLDGTGDFLVAEVDDRVVAMGALRRVDECTAEVKRMRVALEHQRRGMGERILETLIARARELGYRRLVLDTSPKQIPAQRLYEKKGFRRFVPAGRDQSEILFYELNLE